MNTVKPVLSSHLKLKGNKTNSMNLYPPTKGYLRETCKSQNILFCLFVCLFVFVALRPMSTAMVIAGRSVHLTTLFPGQA